MPIERSQEVERKLIRTGRCSTPKLAQEISVSIAAISLGVTALRLRGHDIRAERHEDGWHHVVAGKQNPGKQKAHASTLSIHDD